MKIHNFAIIGIVTALLISLTSLCSAYTLPDENRWIKIVDSEQYDNWFDLETVKTYRANSFFVKIIDILNRGFLLATILLEGQ